MSATDEKEPPDRGINRSVDVSATGCVVVVVSVVGGIVIGWVIAGALNVSGVRQILICGAAVFVLTWCVLGTLLISKRSTTRN